MPVRDHTEFTFGATLNVGDVPEPDVFPGGTVGPLFRAAFGLENDVLAVWDLATRPEFERDPNFNNYEKTKNSRYWDNYRDLFLGVESRAQWDSIAARIDREEKQREILAAAGPGAALIATLSAGIASPTMLIPGLTPLRGLKGIAAAAALGTVAAGAQEVPLQLAQETRTFEEGMTSVAAGALMGGLIGGAAQALGVPKAVGQVFDDLEAQFVIDMARARGTKAISEVREGQITLPLTTADLSRTKIVDDAGQPLTVYHGTTKDIKRFVEAGSGENGMTLGRGIYFSADRSYAESIILESPAEARAAGRSLTARQTIPGSRVVEAQVLLENPLVYKSGMPTGEELNTFAREQGHDGIIYPTGTDLKNRYREIVVFNPDAVRIVDSVVQEGPFIRTPSASPATDAVPQSAGSAAVPRADAGGFAKGPFGKDISWLGKISPVVQTIAQSTFPAARRAMSKLSTAGMRFDGNADFIPAARGGTVEANVGLYDAYIAKLVKTVDEHYADYMYQGQVKPSFPVKRAALRSTFKFTGEKMTREQFNSEIARAMFTGDVHPVKQVADSAKLLRSEIFDPILEEAKKTGLFEEGDLFDDASYLARMYDTNKIDQRPEVFVQKIAKHFETLLQDEVARASDRLKAQKRVLDEYMADVNAEAEVVEARRAEFQARLDAMEETDDEARLTALRRERRQIRAKEGPRSYQERKADEARLAEIKEEIKTFEKGLGARLDEKRGLQRRLRNLNRSFVAVEEKRQKKLERIMNTEDAALNSLKSVLARGRKLERDMDKLSDEQLLKQVSAYAMRWNNAEEALDRHMKRLEGFAADGDMQGFAEYMLKRDGAIEEARAAIAKYEDDYQLYKGMQEDREVLRELLTDLAVRANEKVNEINLNRGKRIAKLEQEVEKLSPEAVAERIAKKTERFKAREMNVRERFRARGVDDFDFETGNAAVTAVARSRAEEAVYKIGKYNNRVSGLHILGEERGSELARVLSIPSIEIFDFLITDIERVTRNYIRQVAADIELKRAFGDVDAKMAFKEMEEEFFRVQAEAQARGATKREIEALSDEHRKHVRNVAASISRLRHTWGIPENPDGFVARAGKVMLDLATLRFMGSVAISSIPDLSRLVVKHGYKRVFGQAFGALIKDFKTFQLSARELKLAGGALDPIIHSRAMAFAEILDENIGHTMPERVIHTLSTKMGLIAGFDYWTSAMKQMAGVLDVTRMMDSIDLVVNGGGTAKEIKEATIYLAENGFDADLARRVWDEVQAGGGNKVNGLWLPNTEDWADQELVRSFRAAIRQANNNTIITPGLEVPLAANASMGMRLLFQFKSFALASHTKVLMSGLQQKDMALLHGVGFSLALGAFSYYIWATTVGGEAYDSMMEASVDKWLDEAIARSGLLGAFSEVQRIAERLPLTAPYANFSGEQTTRRAGASLVEAVLGPSFDTANTAASVLAGIDDPTKSTVAQFFNLLPFNNVFYLRRLFDMAEEEASSGLPERRQK